MEGASKVGDDLKIRTVYRHIQSPGFIFTIQCSSEFVNYPCCFLL